MEFEFDKEIDAILRKARGSVEAVTSPPAHMDADELAAFAENTVSGAAHTRYVSHLADCTRCRKILSNIILSNPEAEIETASSVVSAPAKTERVPWYRRFFVFPQLAYTMGGAVLVFSAFFGYLIIRNLPGASNSDVSFSTDKAPAAANRSAANAQSEPIAAANSNTASVSTNSAVPSISSAPSNTSSTTNSAPVTAANSSSAAKQALPEKPDDNAPMPVPQATVAPDAKLKDESFTVDGETRDDLAKATPASPAAGVVRQNRPKEEAQKNTADASVSRTEEKADEQQAKRKPSPKALEKTRSIAGDTRNVGGKTFNNVGGIWFDSAVGKQKQKTVRRGTSEYLRLDAGLRSIADQLGGTVVVLWSGKAYRIE